VNSCGQQLWGCRCNGYRPALRTKAEVDALHAEAVERARWSGFANQLVPGWVVAVLWPEAFRDNEKAA
jgi:hypothetical protein